MANNEFITVLDKNAISDVERINKEIEKMISNINKANQASKGGFTNPSGSTNNTNTNNSNTANANRNLNEQQRLIQKIADARKADAIEIAKLRLQLAELNKENKKAAQEALGTLNSYQKLSAELNQLRLEAKALAADMFLLEQAGEQNSDQYRELASSYDLVSRRVNLLNDGLTNIDRNLGDHRRNVGNYESGWNGLGNAINQLTREAPAFANSIQTGFMAISNNIPALFDALRDLTQQNERLRNEGQATVPVLRQFASAMFSWQTGLSLGVTLLTFYGKELGNWIKSLFAAKKAVDGLAQAQLKLNQIRLKSEKDVIDEITTYRLYLSTARDVNKSLEERQIAVQKLQKEYAFYFGKLTEQQILEGDTASAVTELNKALEARANVAGISEEYNKNQARILDIEHAIGKANATINKEYQRQNELRKEASRTGISQADALEKSFKAYNQASADLERLTPQLLELKAVQQELIKTATDYKKVAIGLEFQPDEEEKIKLQTEALKDFYASEYELIQTRLQNQAEANKRILEDETVNYADREKARAEYISILGDMATRQRDEELRVLKNTSDEEIAELRRRVREQEITEKNANEVIYTIRRQLKFDSLKSEEDYQERIRQMRIAEAEALKGVYDKINFQKGENLIDERSVENSQNYAASLQDIIDGNKDYRKIEEANKEFQIAQRDITKANIQLEIDRIETELRGLKDTEANVHKRIELEGELINKKKELDDVTVREAEEQAAAMAKLQKATEDYLNTFTEGFIADAGLESLNKFLIIQENGKTMFENLMAGAKGVEGSVEKMREQFKVAFTAITEVAQEAFNFLNQNSQAYFDAQYSRLDREKEVALKFAGESESGRAEIERQYEEKRREIRRRELQQQKEQALFNAVINTAQAVVAALPNIPLSIIVGAIGAAQIAAIQAREIPAFKDGVRGFEGGMAWVGDGGRSEIIKTPSGGLYRTPATDTLVNLPKGSDVYKSELDFIRNSGTLLGGMPHIELEKGGLTKSDLADVMGDVMSGAATNIINIDKRGFNAHTRSQNSRHERFNRMVSFKSRTFRG